MAYESAGRQSHLERGRNSFARATILAGFALGCQAINDGSEFAILRLRPDAGLPRTAAPDDCHDDVAQLRCVGDVVVQCSEGGEWQPASEPCTFGCSGGACLQCAPGSLGCAEVGSVPRQCSELGRWVSLGPCDFERPYCSEGVCLACAVGARRCSAEGVPQTCTSEGTWSDEAGCGEGQTCVAATGACGRCSEGDARRCVGLRGNCASGRQLCRADSTWGPCDVEPREDTCDPGDDGNCDGIPNAPDSGGCTCEADVPCGLSSALAVGQCRLGTSVCAAGVAGECTGVVTPAERDCSSSLDNDCDGAPDNSPDQTCPCDPSVGPGDCPDSYPNVGRCRAARRVCLGSTADNLSSYWAECVGGVAPGSPDCRSSEDNDCDGQADDQSDRCECPPGATQACGSASCSGTRACLTVDDWQGSFWGTCELPDAWGVPELITGLGVPGELWGPALSDDARTLVFGGGGPEDIYMATRAGRGAAFSPARPITEVNTAADEGTPFLTSDGLGLYFYAVRPEGVGQRDIWLATRATPTGAWGAPRLVENVNGEANEQNPWVSRDGRIIVFDSNRARGDGGPDLWLARRDSVASSFGTPVSLREVNTSAFEEGPALSPDALTLFFASTRGGGGGGDLDIWSASRPGASSAFSAPTPVTELNTDGTELDLALSSDGEELFFSSSRDSRQQLYRALRNCQ
jgi:hypothetical protein